MGYDTSFEGSVMITGLTRELKDYINSFSYVRHMKRDNEAIKKMDPDWAEHCFNGLLGMEGAYYIAPKFLKGSQIRSGGFVYGGISSEGIVNNFHGQAEDVSVLDGNRPADECPGLWCQWVINDNGELEWDGGEKFYNYKEWLCYLIEHFFKPSGCVLNGSIQWRGDESDDMGVILVKDNTVYVGEPMFIIDYLKPLN